MTEPGPVHLPGGALSHPHSSARLALAGGLLALGLGDLAVINLMLLPRYLAARQGPRLALLARARRVAALATPAAPLPSPEVTRPGAPPPTEKPSPTVAGAPPPSEPAVAAAGAAPSSAPTTAPSTTPSPAPVLAGAEPPPPAAAAEPAPPATEPFPDLLFAINASWLSRASRETLDRVVEALGQDPARRVVLSGHTDPSGAVDINRALSRGRARQAARYLQAQGVAAERIEIHSFGSARPAAGEVTRARNRRVEIEVH